MEIKSKPPTEAYREGWEKCFRPETLEQEFSTPSIAYPPIRGGRYSGNWDDVFRKKKK